MTPTARRRTTLSSKPVEARARELIDAALTWGGRYYLPYRPYASREEFERAYPLSGPFFQAKRRYDPDGLFRNRFSLQYGPPRGVAAVGLHLFPVCFRSET